MEYDVFGTQGRIDFGAVGVEEVLQNVRTLLNTRKFSVPLHRALGVSATMLDTPIPKAQSALRVEIIEVIRKYEPRAEVKRVTFDGDGTGVLIPRVTVKVHV